MRVSHETIYMLVFVQGRGALGHELFLCPRPGRAMRSPKGARQPTGKGIINDMVMISERPAEVEDRAVPGHWEGDLIKAGDG
jgi:IS30 family transposase